MKSMNMIVKRVILYENFIFSMANSYRENYIYSGDEFSFFSSKVFCSWDYGITDKSAGLLKHKSVFNELQVCSYMVLY